MTYKIKLITSDHLLSDAIVEHELKNPADLVKILHLETEVFTDGMTKIKNTSKEKPVLDGFTLKNISIDVTCACYECDPDDDEELICGACGNEGVYEKTLHEVAFEVTKDNERLTFNEYKKLKKGNEK